MLLAVDESHMINTLVTLTIFQFYYAAIIIHTPACRASSKWNAGIKSSALSLTKCLLTARPAIQINAHLQCFCSWLSISLITNTSVFMIVFINAWKAVCPSSAFICSFCRSLLFFFIHKHPNNEIDPLSVNPCLVLFRVAGGDGASLSSHRLTGSNTPWEAAGQNSGNPSTHPSCTAYLDSGGGGSSLSKEA